MSDPNIDQGTFWGVIATAVIAIGAALGRAKGWFRSERVAEAGADVEVASSNAAETTIKTLTKWVQELTEEIHKLRAEVRQLILQNNDCETKNLMLTHQVNQLSQRVGKVEKESQ